MASFRSQLRCLEAVLVYSQVAASLRALLDRYCLRQSPPSWRHRLALAGVAYLPVRGLLLLLILRRIRFSGHV